MVTFTKFDPNAFLESAGCGGGSAKGPQTDGTLATVPGTPAPIQAPRFALGVANGRSGGWSDNCDGRTAFEGGAPQAWAEALARLDPAHPPRDVPRQRWVQFIDDCGRGSLLAVGRSVPYGSTGRQSTYSDVTESAPTRRSIKPACCGSSKAGR